MNVQDNVDIFYKQAFIKKSERGGLKNVIHCVNFCGAIYTYQSQNMRGGKRKDAIKKSGLHRKER